MNFSKELPPDFKFTRFIKTLKTVFDKMGDTYNSVANQYDFNCTGCEDNCCLTRFYHHTLLEHLYIEAGFKTLSPEKQAAVIERAGEVVKKAEEADIRGELVRVMCPLNEEGMCILYEYRPMVCRLHGLEHELVKPGQPPLRSSGCDLFIQQTDSIEYIKFDRTPHYIEMAKLEREIRQTSGYMKKIKHTIAEMLLL